MASRDAAVNLPEHPHLLRSLAWIAIAGCVVFAISILIADQVVPEHDWMADTISDLGAGRYEFIVDMGIYAYAGSLFACAVGAAHAHLGGRGWTLSIYGLILTGLLVFLIGARNEYGDGDDEGWVIHSYLVYAIGLTYAVMPWAMSEGMGRISKRLKWIARGVTVAWVPLAPIFFFFPNGYDGAYERFLGAVTFVFVIALAATFFGRAAAIDGRVQPSGARDAASAA